MSSLVVMEYSYDRRPHMAGATMSPWFLKLCDQIAKKQKSKIEGRAEDVGKHGDFEALVEKHFTASDDEIVKLALASLEFNWSDILDDYDVHPLIMKWVDHNINQCGVAAEDDSFAQIDVDRNNNLVVKCIAWGQMYEYDSDDPWSRTEVPAQHDLDPENDLEKKFKLTGAQVNVKWEWKTDPSGYDADVVTFPMTLKWYFDDKVLSQKYGGEVFSKALKEKLPEIRREVEQEKKDKEERGSRAPSWAMPPAKRRKK